MNVMPYSESDRRVPSIKERRLRELHRWLTYEGLSAFVMILAYFPLTFGLLTVVLVGAAILFTPYMLWRLHQCGRHGWIVGFAVTVGIPLMIVLLVGAGSLAGPLLSLIPLAFFYAYTWVLRHTVGEWLVELRWTRSEDDPLAEYRI